MQNHKALCTSNIFFSYSSFHNIDEGLCLTVLPSKLRWVFYYSHRLVGSLFYYSHHLLGSFRRIKKKFASVNNRMNSLCSIFRQILRMFFVFSFAWYLSTQRDSRTWNRCDDISWEAASAGLWHYTSLQMCAGLWVPIIYGAEDQVWGWQT